MNVTSNNTSYKKGDNNHMEGRFVSYIRVSTSKQGINGLGMEAQRKAITDFLNGGKWELLGEYKEVESGKKSDRPELMKALEHCKRTKSTLLIARIDRLSRNAAFLFNLQESGVKFKAVDMPNANDMTVGIMILVAQDQREYISKRTKEALAAAKARGVKLGSPKGLSDDAIKHGREKSLEVRSTKSVDYSKRMYGIIKGFIDEGLSLRAIAKKMEEKKELTPRDGFKWSAATVRNVLKKVEGC